jgi:hypothetical protein
MFDKSATAKEIAQKVLHRARGAAKTVGGAAKNVGGTVKKYTQKHPVGTGIAAAGVGGGTVGGVLAAKSKQKKKTTSEIADSVLTDVACATPGEKIRSKGKGRGFAVGKGKGPLGRMADELPQDSKKSASEIADSALMKVGFSVTEEGHKWDADRAAARQQYFIGRAKALQEKDAIGYRDPEGGRHRGSLLSALRFGEWRDPVAALRRQAYIEKAHREGRNAWNPLGGRLTPHASEFEAATPWTYGKIE